MQRGKKKEMEITLVTKHRLLWGKIKFYAHSHIFVIYSKKKNLKILF